MGDEVVEIGARYHGPETSAHGGYAVGVLADLVDPFSVDATLRAPPPLEVPLTVERDGARVRLVHGSTLVAEASPAGDGLDFDPPRDVGDDEVEAAVVAYERHVAEHGHFFPTCFGCGPERDEGDALRLFSGPVPGGDLHAASWRPDPSVVESGGIVPRLVWAALDCPSGWAAMGQAGEPIAAVLGRFRGRIHHLPRAGHPHVIVSWGTGIDGRKLSSRVALQDEDRTVLAVGEALWIRVDPPARS